MKLDIIKNELYIGKLRDVIHGYIPKRIVPMQTIGRQNDGFIYIIQGACRYTFDDNTTFTAKQGDLLYLAYNSKYLMEVQSEKYEFVYFDFIFPDERLRQSAVFKMKNPGETSNIFFRLKSNFENKKGIALCMTDVYRIYALARESQNPEYLSASARERLNIAVKYIIEHLSDEELCVADIANSMNISEVYLRKLFKARYGTTPSGFITEIKLENACKMLKTGMFTIEETAFQSGFKNPSYFSHVFKNVKGITPLQYKQNNA